jgi:hypothetical protein
MRCWPALLVALAVVGCGGGDRESPAPPPPAAAAPAAPKRPALCGTLRSRVIGQVTEPSATELSGLVRSRTQRGLLWSHNDSGAGPELYGLRTDGSVAAHPQVTGAQAIDWEDIATGPGPNGSALLYIGDIGDNGAARPTIDVYRVAEPKVGDAVTAPAARLTLRYPDRPHDAEALLVDPIRGDLVIVTKVIGGGRAYRTSARARAGTYTLAAGPSVDLSFVTAGDVSADGRVVVLRGYDRVGIWTRRGRERLTTTLARAPCVSPTSLIGEGQGEAIALDRHGTSFVTVPEGSPATLRRYAPKG